jgi:hypothetical protein
MHPAYFLPHRLPAQVDYEEDEEASEEGGLHEELIGLDEEGNNTNGEGIAKPRHCPVSDIPSRKHIAIVIWDRTRHCSASRTSQGGKNMICLTVCVHACMKACMMLIT